MGDVPDHGVMSAGPPDLPTATFSSPSSPQSLLIHAIKHIKDTPMTLSHRERPQHTFYLTSSRRPPPPPTHTHVEGELVVDLYPHDELGRA